jgi:hypothetical protein
MEPIRNTYPIFEANQVLTKEHLNQVFNYLDEQERLTRANLIGIGIVCGLEIRYDKMTQHVHLTKGCGVTSEGYLIVEPDNLELGSYRDYKPPDDLSYEPLAGKTLWELLVHDSSEAKTANAKNLNAFQNLKDMVVLLFLELKNEELRNCSPNNCNDKGSEVTVTVRRLLIAKKELDQIILAANKNSTDLNAADLAASLTKKLGLPDFRLPRYDVPKTNLATTNDVLSGFFEVFQANKLAGNTHILLNAAYNSFEPLVKDLSAGKNPFANFKKDFDFLDAALKTGDQVRFLQNYYDFFADLLQAYEEFRWAGIDLMCACCPPQELFPRHLMLGEAIPPEDATTVTNYRHLFLASPAISRCQQQTSDLRLLFQRLLTMVKQFSHNPVLPKANSEMPDSQIRITPSKHADVLLSAKCIPYYYSQGGDPRLFEVWSPEKTRRRRATQNLSYRADEYSDEAFVTDPLRFDLEPYNFLRIEGHLGKNFKTVVDTLLELKDRYRLPIDIVALRTGALDETITVDLSQEECWFQDLETQYRVLREELRCFLCKEMQYFYGVRFEFESPNAKPYAPREPLLKACAPNFLVRSQTVGDYFEEEYQDIGKKPYLEPEVLLRDNIKIKVLTAALWHLLYYSSKLTEVLPVELGKVNYAEVENRYTDLVRVATLLEGSRVGVPKEFDSPASLLAYEELDDRIEAIIYACRLDAFKALRDERERRIREVKRKQFLNFFLQKNPGIQHKAGVPLGGTFIVVYHDEPEPVKADVTTASSTDLINRLIQQPDTSEGIKVLLRGLGKNINVFETSELRDSIQEAVRSTSRPTGGVKAATESVLSQEVKKIPDGTVIADFFLPYLCCSDCAPIQFVLPQPPLTFTSEVGCTNSDGFADVTIKPQNGVAPFKYQIGDGPLLDLTDKISLKADSPPLILQDSVGAKSQPQSINIPEPLRLTAPTTLVLQVGKEFSQALSASGGTPPYTFGSEGTLPGGLSISVAGVLSGTPNAAGSFTPSITVTDARKCSTKMTLPLSIQPPPCAYSIAPLAQTFGAQGGTGKVAVNAQPANCTWTAIVSPNAPWIKITSGASGAGNGEVNYEVSPNDSPTVRTGQITIAGQTFTVTQTGGNAAPTLTTISPTGTTMGNPGLTLTVMGTGFQPGSRVRWNGTDRTTTFVNGTQLTAAITAADVAAVSTASVTVVNPAPGGGVSNALPFTVTNCTFGIQIMGQVVPASGGTVIANVNTASVCIWKAASNVPWITIQTGASVTGSGTATFLVQPNTGPVPRQGSIFVADRNFGINQEAATTQILCPVITGITPKEATPGMSVAIRGSNFKGVSKVTFGNGVAVPFLINDDSIITFTVPENAGSGLIVVSKPGCQDVRIDFVVLPIKPFSGIVPLPGMTPTPEKKTTAKPTSKAEKEAPKKSGKAKVPNPSAQRKKGK